jgi:hypothetical protein
LVTVLICSPSERMFTLWLWSYSCLPSMSAVSILYFKVGKFFVTLNTLSVGERIKQVIKINKPWEICKMVWRVFKCMEIVGGEELKILYSWLMCVI